MQAELSPSHQSPAENELQGIDPRSSGASDCARNGHSILKAAFLSVKWRKTVFHTPFLQQLHHGGSPCMTLFSWLHAACKQSKVRSTQPYSGAHKHRAVVQGLACHQACHWIPRTSVQAFHLAPSSAGGLSPLYMGLEAMCSMSLLINILFSSMLLLCVYVCIMWSCTHHDTRVEVRAQRS